MRFISVVTMTICLSACAGTPYQKMGIGGGYDDKKVTETSWGVEFKSNVASIEGFAEQAALYRSAEIARSKGFPYFAITSASVGFHSYGSGVAGVSVYGTTRGQTARLSAVGLMKQDDIFDCATENGANCAVLETEAVLRDYDEVMKMAGRKRPKSNR